MTTQEVVSVGHIKSTVPKSFLPSLTMFPNNYFVLAKKTMTGYIPLESPMFETEMQARIAKGIICYANGYQDDKDIVIVNITINYEVKEKEDKSCNLTLH